MSAGRRLGGFSPAAVGSVSLQGKVSGKSAMRSVRAWNTQGGLSPRRARLGVLWRSNANCDERRRAEYDNLWANGRITGCPAGSTRQKSKLRPSEKGGCCAMKHRKNTLPCFSRADAWLTKRLTSARRFHAGGDLYLPSCST
jgi:hypothetical protein